MKKALTIFFAALDKMYQDMDDFRENAEDSFWASSIDYAIVKSKVKKYKENPLLNKGVRLVNGRTEHPMVFVWRDSTKGDNAEFFNDSETVKKIHSYNGYELCLIRDYEMCQDPTATRWSNQFIGKDDNGTFYKHKYAILKDDVVLFSTHKKWLFEQKLLNKDFEGESLEYELTPTGILRQFNPFKLKILNREEDINEIRHLEEECGWSFYCPTLIIQDMDDNNISTKDLWIVFMIGLPNVATTTIYGKGRNATWWGMYSKDKPSNDDAIESVLSTLQWYREHGEFFTDVLTQKREESYDLNKLDFHWEERLRYMYTEKVPYSFGSVLGETRMRDIFKIYDEEILQCS